MGKKKSEKSNFSTMRELKGVLVREFFQEKRSDESYVTKRLKKWSI